MFARQVESKLHRLILIQKNGFVVTITQELYANIGYRSFFRLTGHDREKTAKHL